MIKYVLFLLYGATVGYQLFAGVRYLIEGNGVAWVMFALVLFFTVAFLWLAWLEAESDRQNRYRAMDTGFWVGVDYLTAVDEKESKEILSVFVDKRQPLKMFPWSKA
ncbi:MAG: hypothetical protein E6R03_17455 [Hyphomicrobiaceae bacterium]|nr:MAG: hypothetical protein E6R03_17455 [Hyphomicrobiaceae bacterium]